jgi:hypothetical protein
MAKEKDPGFAPDVFAEMLGRIDRLKPAEFGMDSDDLERLRSAVARWRELSLDIAERDRARGMDGPDLGL